MKRFFIGFAFVAIVALTSISAQQDQPRVISEQDAPVTLKILLVKQSTTACGDGFCDLGGLIRLGFPFLGTPSDAVSFPLGDRIFRLTRSEDHRHYQASLTPARGCGIAWFTDERQGFYSGKIQGC